jgi:hypothetical protein
VNPKTQFWIGLACITTSLLGLAIQLDRIARAVEVVAGLVPK